MQPVFLFKKRTGAMGGHVAGTAGFCVAVPAFYSWSMSEVIDKDTRSSERTDYPHYASEVALAFGSRVVGLELAKMMWMRGWAHSTKAVVINNAWRRLRQ